VPSFAAQRIGNRGKGEPRHRTIRALVEEIAKFTHESVGETTEIDNHTSDDDDDVVLVPFPFQ